jgi:hypothetical protein
LPVPDAAGKAPLYFLNKKIERFDTPVDTAWLRQVRAHVVNLICTVIDLVTTMGWQFPGGAGPGEEIWKTRASVGCVFHVLLTLEGEGGRIVLQDISESDLRSKFVKAYNHGKSLFLVNELIPVDKVRRVRILVTEEDSKTVLGRDQQARIDSDVEWNRQTRQNRGTMIFRLHMLGPDDLAHLNAGFPSLGWDRPGTVAGCSCQQMLCRTTRSIPVELERDFQTSVAKGNGNDDDPDSPARQGYGEPGCAIRELRAWRQEVAVDVERWPAWPEPVHGRRW